MLTQMKATMNYNYLDSINYKETKAHLVSLNHYAHQHNVPIITEEGLRFLRQLILLTNAKKVLEIGTAIGYSALCIADIDKSIQITTIEKDSNMSKLAENNFKQYDHHNQITLINEDALTYEPTNERFDLIFIDAAKAQSIKFFEKYTPFLNRRGLVVTDNLLFKGLVGKPNPSKNLNALLKKIDAFNHYLVSREDYHTVIYSIGDGMSVSIKKR